MKAITLRRYGPPDALGFEDVPHQSPGEAMSSVRVRAGPIFAGDWQVVQARGKVVITV